MVMYLIKTCLATAAIFLFYRLFLEKEKMLKFNRAYLLGGLVFALLVPFIPSIDIFGSTSVQTSSEGLAAFSIIPTQISSLQEGSIAIDLFKTLQVFYLIGVIYMLGRFIYNMLKIVRSIAKNKMIYQDNFKIILMQKGTIPYSFLDYIFIDRDDFLKGGIDSKILVHEQAHVEQKHSYDIILMEIIAIVFWFNPSIYLIKNSLKLTHEFLADEKVLDAGNEAIKYQELLLRYASNQNINYLASNLNFLMTKKRFLMMTKNKKKYQSKFFSLLMMPLFCAMIFLFGNNIQAQNTKASKTSQEQQNLKNDYFKDATIIFTDRNGNEKQMKYSELSANEREALPPPPPLPPGHKSMVPLAPGTKIHMDAKGNVKINSKSSAFIPPPPPPPPTSATPPPPPPPPVTIDMLISEGAKFFYEGKSIDGSKAKEIMEKNGRNISVKLHKGRDGQEVHLTKEK